MVEVDLGEEEGLEEDLHHQDLEEDLHPRRQDRDGTSLVEGHHLLHPPHRYPQHLLLLLA